MPAVPNRLAVLIDAENISPKVVEKLFEDVRSLGIPTIRRVYGDLTHSKGWIAASARFALLSRQQFVRSSGKNSTDICMVVDAMDIMARDRIDGVCLVSSDSDFTALAIRLREQGLKVYGFGERAKTPECFRTACDRFLPVDRVVADVPAPSKDATSHLSDAIRLIKGALAKSTAIDGLVALSIVGNHIKNSAPEFSARYCGPGKLRKLVQETGQFEIVVAAKGHASIRASGKPALTLIKPAQASRS